MLFNSLQNCSEGEEGKEKGVISQFCQSAFYLPYLNLLEEKVFTKVTSFSLTFLGALCGGGGFPVAEKVFLSLEIGACLEWQRTGGLLRTDTDECSCNQDGLPLLVYAVSYLLVFAVLCAAICCLYCSKQPIEQESCGLLSCV